MTTTVPITNGKEHRVADRIVSAAEIRFGQPTIAGTGVPVAIVFERFQAGDSIAELAADYALPVADIEAAIRHEAAVNNRAA